MAERIRAVHVTALLHGDDAHDGMGVIGCGDDHAVQSFTIEHLTKIRVECRARQALRRGSKRLSVYIAERDDVLSSAGFEMKLTLTRDPNHPQVQPLVG